MLPVTVVFPLFIAVVLIASGILKLPERQRTLKSFEAFGVPAALRKPWAAIAFPIGEIVVGAAVILGTGPLYYVAAGLASLLMLAYVIVVARSVAKKQVVDCNCFGALSTAPVSRATIIRNAGLLAIALVATLDPTAGAGVIPRLAQFSVGDWLWLLVVAAAVAAGVVASLIAKPAPATPSLTALDYETDPDAPDLMTAPTAREQIPHSIELVSRDGDTELLYNLVVVPQKTTILIFARVGCGSCTPVLQSVPAWAERLAPHAQIIVATSTGRAKLDEHYPELAPFAYFGSKAASEAFGADGTPAAMLLAGDGTVASFPEYGYEIISERVEQLAASFAQVN